MSRTGDGLDSNDDSLILKFVSYSVFASSLVLLLHVSLLSLASELPTQSKRSRTGTTITKVRSSRCRNMVLAVSMDLHCTCKGIRD